MTLARKTGRDFVLRGPHPRLPSRLGCSQDGDVAVPDVLWARERSLSECL